jgi:HAD superfamily hydrolase (TIGR01509 family)
MKADKDLRQTMIRRLTTIRPAPLDAVIFDLDGLLLDSERVYERVTREALAAMGFEMSATFYGAIMGLPGTECDAMLRKTFGAGFCSETFKQRFLALAKPCFEAGVPLKAGALELLDDLDRLGIAKAVATSSERRALEIKMRGAGIRERFSVVVTRDDVERGKPHPDAFLSAARGLGARPRHCVALEDSHNGVRAAHAAGMSTVMVPDLVEPTAEIAALCAAVVRDLHEARRLLVY